MACAFLSAAIVDGEGSTPSHELKESSRQTAHTRHLRTATSPLPFSRQIAPPSIRDKRVITPIPTGAFRATN
ncbi:hypothetical protein KIN20_025010 [Parelaphostrongylus tenuis]|uniref:Uncharacterized protein n=1 Tax=Parelaphostrongylus tenuis TaxID=148309 RepID=A0AAD5MUI3_PARTN|nr:hypothetical protein KIN20_025010 [Parelaphostrongylus tenuis]